jgi:hypothetical protein
MKATIRCCRIVSNELAFTQFHSQPQVLLWVDCRRWLEQPAWFRCAAHFRSCMEMGAQLRERPGTVIQLQQPPPCWIGGHLLLP